MVIRDDHGDIFRELLSDGLATVALALLPVLAPGDRVFSYLEPNESQHESN